MDKGRIAEIAVVAVIVTMLLAAGKKAPFWYVVTGFFAVCLYYTVWTSSYAFLQLHFIVPVSNFSALSEDFLINVFKVVLAIVNMYGSAIIYIAGVCALLLLFLIDDEGAEYPTLLALKILLAASLMPLALSTAFAIILVICAVMFASFPAQSLTVILIGSAVAIGFIVIGVLFEFNYEPNTSEEPSIDSTPERQSGNLPNRLFAKNGELVGGVTHSIDGKQIMVNGKPVHKSDGNTYVDSDGNVYRVRD